MSIKSLIESDIKTAMLAGDKELATTLRGLKSAILYAEVAANKREEGLSDEEAIVVLNKEAKKRQESADMYLQGGSSERSEAELNEKKAIQKYLPAQISDSELSKIIDDAITVLGATGMQSMGQVIAAVKKQTKGSADGAAIARITKDALTR